MASSSGNFLMKFRYRALDEAWILISWAKEKLKRFCVYLQNKKEKEQNEEKNERKGK